MQEQQVERFEGWMRMMHPRLARFEDFIMPVEWSGGYTRDSLVELERYILDRWPEQQDFLDTAGLDFIDGAVRYIGETYLRLAGGGWSVDRDPDFIYAGRPVVRFDREDRIPVSPFHLLTTIQIRRTGDVLSRIWDGQSKNILERRASEAPGWTPKREPISGVVAERLEGGPEVLAWVERVPTLVSSLTSDTSSLDLSLESMADLAECALRDLSVGALHGDEGRERREAYVAYLGEVARRARGGRWMVRPGAPNDTNPFVGRPYVEHETQAGDSRWLLAEIVVLGFMENPEVERLVDPVSNYVNGE